MAEHFAGYDIELDEGVFLLVISLLDSRRLLPLCAWHLLLCSSSIACQMGMVQCCMNQKMEFSTMMLLIFVIVVVHWFSVSHCMSIRVLRLELCLCAGHLLCLSLSQR